MREMKNFCPKLLLKRLKRSEMKIQNLEKWKKKVLFGP